ncbi:hypothetical protein [Archangium sp.]|uniref:hypothetical protein n=1 Tax=Archangium sp. TaxID=1872627 RepID=UPI00389B1814
MNNPTELRDALMAAIGDIKEVSTSFGSSNISGVQAGGIVLVGSNGGMLHAIHAGSALSRSRESALDDVHDLGTGQELWAFIPPDLLPKLGLMVNGHEFFVDGTPMVRDLWVDGSAGKAGVKEPSEYHTLAILSERSGGQRFVALDVTNPREMLNVNGKPFRIRYQVAITGAGEQPTTENLGTRRNVSPDVSWMVVPRNLHECRHVNAQACDEE